MALTSHDGRLLLSHPGLHQDGLLAIPVYPGLLLPLLHCLQQQAGTQHTPTLRAPTGLGTGLVSRSSRLLGG